MRYTGLLLALIWASTVAASELDLYRGQPVNVPSRIMILVDTSDSMQGLLVSEASGDADGMPDNDITSNETVSGQYYRGTCYERDENGNQIPFGTVVDHENRKICRLKRVLKDLLAEWPDVTEVGLARYAEPGAVIEAPLMRLDEQYSRASGGSKMTHRAHMVEIINDLILGATKDVNDNIIPFGGYTPLAGSYIEVAQYLAGGRPVSSFSTLHSFDSWYDESNNLKSIWTDNTKGYYKAPSLGAICDTFNTHLVVLTDGQSTNENMGNTVPNGLAVPPGTVSYAVSNTSLGQMVGTLVGGADVSGYVAGCPGSVASPGIWGCVNTVASKLKSLSLTVDGVVLNTPIKTSTIAFSLASYDAVMTAWATAGDGNFYSAQNEEQLRNAFGDIGVPVVSDGTFTATVPGVSINQTNRFSHENEFYFSLFDPSERPFWYGNLKKYKLTAGDTAGSDPVIRGENNVAADAAQDGFFDSGVRSYWSNSTDGDVVHKGGAAEEIGAYAGRNLFVDIGSYSRNKSLTNVKSSGDSTNLAAFKQDIDVSYSAADKLPGDYLDTVLNWLIGRDVGNEWNALTGTFKTDRTLYGAPIHSAPILVNYTSTSSGQPLTLANQDNVVFLGTNDGKLYAVDADDGSEKFAFIPGELTHRQNVNEKSFIDKAYDAATSNSAGAFLFGLDSSWVAWRQDRGGSAASGPDGNIRSADGDFVYLFGGMRRGGRNYYSLDVTDALSTPSVRQRFMLKGGTSGSPLENMGQTWSEPVLALMKYNNENVVVMLVGGGYDPLYDDTTALPNGQTAQGAQLYAVLAHEAGDGKHAGDVLWWASNGEAQTPTLTDSSLRHSIPSTLKTIDRDRDGYIDHIYVGDLGGQLHRFDIIQNQVDDGAGNLSNATTIAHSLVAQLGHEGVSLKTPTNNRRFFYPPSIAVMGQGASRYVGIAIGSGYITSPNDQAVNERFYFIKDFEPFGTDKDTYKHGNTSGSGVTDLNLVEVDDTVPTESLNTDAAAVSIQLTRDAEKLLGSPLIINGQVYFTTYYKQATQVLDDQCSASGGQAALYSYTPGASYVKQVKVDLPQSAAGTLGVVLLNDLSDTGDSGSSEIIGLPGGPAAIPMGDLPNTARRTRWFECSSADCP